MFLWGSYWRFWLFFENLKPFLKNWSAQCLAKSKCKDKLNWGYKMDVSHGRSFSTNYFIFFWKFNFSIRSYYEFEDVSSMWVSLNIWSGKYDFINLRIYFQSTSSINSVMANREKKYKKLNISRTKKAFSVK